jgi:hypothetical protein
VRENDAGRGDARPDACAATGLQNDVIKAINGDPFIGMFETPVTSSPLVRARALFCAPARTPQNRVALWQAGTRAEACVSAAAAAAAPPVCRAALGARATAAARAPAHRLRLLALCCA